jgi:hypothetical protein
MGAVTNDVAQLVIFIQGITESFGEDGELANLKRLDATTTGKIVSECL